jgi:hypothetical protein
MKMTLLLPFCLVLSMTMFGQSLTLGAVVYAMPLNGAFEFTLMAAGYQSQPQGRRTQRLPLWEWNLSYLEKRRVRPVPHRVRPQRAGLPLRRNNRENDRHYTRQGLHPNQLSHYKRRLADFEWQWRSERSQARDRTLLANLLQRSRQPLHGRLDPGSLFALKKGNREFGITSHFRFWLGAVHLSLGRRAVRSRRRSSFE